MKNIKAIAASAAALVVLSLAGFAAPALADDAPPSEEIVATDTTPIEIESTVETVPESAPAPIEATVAELTVAVEEPAAVIAEPLYKPVLWKASYLLDPKFPQYLEYTWDSTTTPSLEQFSNYVAKVGECGTTYQGDLYADDKITAALIASGVLNGGDESWVGGSYKGEYSIVITTADCEPEPPVITPTECDSFETLPLATYEQPRGWGDVKNAVWTSEGLQLTAPADQEAYAYVAVDNIPLSSTVNGLKTYGSGSAVAVIIHTDVANVHYESDGQYWTKSGPGLFPETSPGFWSTYDLNEMLQEAYIDEVAVWVNPGNNWLLTGQDYPCVTQPFGAETVPAPIFTQDTTDGELECDTVKGGGSYVETTTYYESDATWDAESGEFVYGEPYVIDTSEETITVEPGEECPTPVIPPVDPPVDPPVTPVTPTGDLAYTGSTVAPIANIGIGALVLGIFALAGGAIVTARRNKISAPPAE